MSVYVLEAIRSPRGKGREGGGLNAIRPVELLRQLFVELQQRTNLDTTQVDEVTLGCVTPINDQGANIAHTAALFAGWQPRGSGATLNSYCTSGLTSCSLAAAKIQAEMGDVYAVGGIESMSRVPMMSDKGPAFTDPEVASRLPFIPNPLIADLVAMREGFSREMLDDYAVASHQKAAAATKKGYFSRSIVPIRDEGGAIVLDGDEAIRPDSTREKMAGLEPLFAQRGTKGFEAILEQYYPGIGTVEHRSHAGCAPAMVDGASLALLGSRKSAERLGLRPRARIIAMSSARAPAHEGLAGAKVAASDALARAGLSVGDIDLWECNEGFAAVVMDFARQLGVPAERLNVNGGGIAMGHAMGATGVNLLSTLVDELERRELKRGMIAISGAVGIGGALIVEREA